MESHLIKIKLLLNLSKSPEPGEAANAAAMALKLIEKFNVTDEQLREIESSDKPIYTDENLLLETPELADWKNILALVVAKKYDCYAIQEENVLTTGEKSFKYYVYGEPEDIIIAKQLFDFVYNEVNKVIALRCTSRGELYRDSFAEGAVNGVRINIEYENFFSPGMVIAKEDKVEEKKDSIANVEKSPVKPPAIEKKTMASNKEKPLDIMAYFIGEGYGRDIHIGEISKRTLEDVKLDLIDMPDLAKLLGK